MKRFVPGGLAVLAAVVLLLGPLAPSGYDELGRAAGLTFDLLVGFGLLWALQFLGGWGKATRWFGSWRCWLLGAWWALYVVFETGRTLLHVTTNADQPVYDAVLLGRHLYILGRDLYGWAATAGLVGVLLAPLLIWVVGALCFARLETVLRPLGPKRGAGLTAAVIVVGLTGWFLPASRWVTPRFVSNLGESVDLYLAFQREVDTRPHRELESLALTSKPDVHIYIVESYGAVVGQDPFVERWAPAVDRIDQDLRTHGWYTASGISTAPVHGGRSWIADASLLTGLHIAHQASYEHLVTVVGRLSHLPGFFARQGYATVLVRPKDEARPGVKLVNHFGFEHTVFRLDLHYRGPAVGWGYIPDQYTIDFVTEEVLEVIDGPTFAFFHLVTAHLPWKDAPDLHVSYGDWNEREGDRRPIFKKRSASDERRMQFSRWKRGEAERRKKKEEGQEDRYLDNVVYDLESINENLLAQPPKRPRLVVILGDHQPPVLARGSNFDVPVHLVASDPALLEGFIDAGFEEGLRPRDWSADIAHKELFATLARALALADGQELP